MRVQQANRYHDYRRLNLVLFISFAFNLFCCLLGIGEAACPSGWKIFHDHCYKFAFKRRTWTDSRAKCKSEGADLVKISSTAENNFVANNKKSSNAWLGLRRGSDHKFYWTDGTRVVFTSWGRGEPNDSGGLEDCGLMWDYRRAKWNDAQCSDRCTYVCEKAPLCLSFKLRPKVQVTPSSCTSAPVPHSKVCSFRCPRGYRLEGPSSKRCTADGQWTKKNLPTTCKDINEYKVNNGGCSHQCVNSIGGYHCACPYPELKLDQGKHTCVVSGTKITCEHDQIRIDIPRALLINLYKEDLTLINKSCGATENSTHFSLVTSLVGCGTVAKETKDKIVYTNKVLERHISKDSVITRMRPLEILFRCSYSRKEVVSAFGVKPIYRKLKFRERANGSFSLALDIFPDNKFRKPFQEKDFPVPVRLRQLIYIQASVKSVEKQLSITTDRCFFTPSREPASKPVYLLINDRCPVDRTVKFLRSPTRDLRRFSVKAFKFVGSRPFAFIHCDVVVCNASDVTSACAKQCQSRGRGKRDSVYHEILTLTRGPLIVFGDVTQALSVKAHRKNKLDVPVSSQAGDDTDEMQGVAELLRTT